MSTNYQQQPWAPRSDPPERPPSGWPGAQPVWEPEPPIRARRRGPLTILVALVAAVALLLSGVGIGWTASQALRGVGSGIQNAAANLPGLANLRAGSASDVIPSVVDINTVVQGIRRSSEAAGTGMVVSSSGEILTNNHVIAGATSITVTLVSTSASYHASVIGVDPGADIALLKIQPRSSLRVVSFAPASNVAVGQHVTAVGNALGRGGSPSVTAGSITAVDQAITAGDGTGQSEQLSGLVQSSAQISPGDSGGPLVNQHGQVVGMITAAQTGGYRQGASSVGYAIPSPKLVSTVELIRSGKPTGDILIGATGFLGVASADVDAGTAAELGLGSEQGALVEGVVRGSAAEQAGLHAGSVITQIDGSTVASSASLGSILHQHKPGDSVQVRWVDTAGSHSASVRLGSGPAV